MRLNLQLTMGTFSLSLFGLMGVAFGMNLESSLEEVRTSFFKYQDFILLFNVEMIRRVFLKTKCLQRRQKERNTYFGSQFKGVMVQRGRKGKVAKHEASQSHRPRSGSTLSSWKYPHRSVIPGGFQVSSAYSIKSSTRL